MNCFFHVRSVLISCVSVRSRAARQMNMSADDEDVLALKFSDFMGSSFKFDGSVGPQATSSKANRSIGGQAALEGRASGGASSAAPPSKSKDPQAKADTAVRKLNQLILKVSTIQGKMEASKFSKPIVDELKELRADGECIRKGILRQKGKHPVRVAELADQCKKFVKYDVRVQEVLRKAKVRCCQLMRISDDQT